MPPGSQASVRLGDIVFSQASVGKLVGGVWEDETVYQTVQEMRRMSIEDRRTYTCIAARFDQVRVVPIRRRLDAPGDSTNRLQVMVSLDNRRLLIQVMRATLPADERINVRIQRTGSIAVSGTGWPKREVDVSKRRIYNQSQRHGSPYWKVSSFSNGYRGVGILTYFHPADP